MGRGLKAPSDLEVAHRQCGQCPVARGANSLCRSLRGFHSLTCACRYNGPKASHRQWPEARRRQYVDRGTTRTSAAVDSNRRANSSCTPADRNAWCERRARDARPEPGVRRHHKHSGNWTRSTVDVDISLAGTSCTDVIYAVYVYDEPGDTGVIAGGAYSGDGVSTTEERYFSMRRDGLRGVRVPNGKAYACAVTYVSSDPTTALDTWGYNNPPPYACTGFELVHQ
jgi:hypothetical protein